VLAVSAPVAPTIAAASAATASAALVVAGRRVGMLGTRVEVDVDNHADGFFPSGNAAVSVMQAFAPFVVVMFVFEVVGNAPFGQQTLAGDPFFVDVECVVFLGRRLRRGGTGTGRLPITIAAATTAAPATTATARLAPFAFRPFGWLAVARIVGRRFGTVSGRGKFVVVCELRRLPAVARLQRLVVVAGLGRGGTR
jgi:hypothetical protein